MSDRIRIKWINWIQITGQDDAGLLRRFSMEEISRDNVRIFRCGGCDAFYVGRVRTLLLPTPPIPIDEIKFGAHICACGLKIPVPLDTVLFAGGRETR